MSENLNELSLDARVIAASNIAVANAIWAVYKQNDENNSLTIEHLLQESLEQGLEKAAALAKTAKAERKEKTIGTPAF